jgi:hypothetical protein
LIRRGHLELARRESKELQSDFSNNGSDALFDGIRGSAPVQPVAPITLTQLMERYEADPSRAKLSPKSRLKQSAWFRTFKELVGADKSVPAITRADASTLLDLLSKLPPNAVKRFPKLAVQQAAAEGQRRGIPPMSPASAKGYFTAFSRFC